MGKSKSIGDNGSTKTMQDAAKDPPKGKNTGSSPLGAAAKMKGPVQSLPAEASSLETAKAKIPGMDAPPSAFNTKDSWDQKRDRALAKGSHK